MIPKSFASRNPPDVVHGKIVKEVDIDTTFQDKLDAAVALYGQWEYKDELEVVKDQDLILQ